MMMEKVEAPMAWSLTRGMARVLGVNLIEAVTEGWYARSELDELVGRCAACGMTEHCTAWLAVTPRATALPGYCHNKQALEELYI
jgi:hypothetical protein